ncbi:MAG TPA: hypothetical protein VED59_02410 [Acidimicrobiales bacterium]|nr:hypothetical protein [Acidimicrobiales bacterium]
MAALLWATAAPVPASAGAATVRYVAITANPLVCKYYNTVRASAPQLFVFTRSTDVAVVNYVGKRCMTITIGGGPDNPNPTARSVASVTYVDVGSQTAFWVGRKPATFAAVTAGAQLLKLEAKGQYTLFRALTVVILPKGAQLPE